MASNFKRIRFFECDQIEDLSSKSSAKGKKGEEAKILETP